MTAADAPRATVMSAGAIDPFRDASLVDLTLTLSEDLPCHWATHQPFQVKTWNWFVDHRHPAASARARNGPYATRWMAIDEHTGTHFDAPCHFIPPDGSGLPEAGPAGGITVDRVPLRQLMGSCAVIDAGLDAGAATDPGVSPLIEPDVVLAWEERFGMLRPDEIVLLRTGWDRHYVPGPDGLRYVYDVLVTGRAAGWPAPSVATMGLLLERGVRCVGTDAPSMGPAHDGRPVHVIALRTGAVFVECLTRLDQLPARGAWFCFLPLHLEGGTGAPGRAVAFLPS
jgi:kynurenine formamidase